MIGPIRDALKHSRVYNFNLLDRDAWVAQQAALLPAGSRVLDVGAGSCPYRHCFAHCEYRTQDFTGLTPEQLRHGGYGQIDFVCDATAIPVPDAWCDAILCTEMIEHVPEPARVMAEFRRILRPGGVLLVTAPLGSGLHQEPYHFYGGFTPFWYRHVLSGLGFDPIEVLANGASFAFYAQESIRFVRTTAPWRLPMPAWKTLLWSPLWCVLAPLLGAVVPFAAHALDRYDREQRFTVGYHVRAVKAA